MVPVVPTRSLPFEATVLSEPSHAGASELPTLPTGNVTPNASQWQSEDWAAQADAQLARLAAWMRLRSETIPDIEADSFTSSSLRPASLKSAYSENGVVVKRGDTNDKGPDHLASLGEAIESLLLGVSKDADLRVAFKTIDVQPLEGGFETTVLVELAYSVQQRNSRWRCAWRVGPDREPSLASIRLDFYEEIERADDRSWFVDTTASVLGSAVGSEQHALGVGAWSQRLTRIDEMTLHGHHGLAVGDVNGDGRDDLYVCDGGGLPNRLYVQQPDGTVRDVSADSKTDWLESSSAALLVDLDNDGDQDLVVATIPLILVSENDGQGGFKFRGGHAAVSSAYTLAAADYDQDGDLDVYATSYSGRAGEKFGARGFEAKAPVPFHDANNGGRNALLENQGAFSFVDVTEDVGLDQNNRRFSFSAAWEDIDNDGDQDLYVANDFGRNNLYRNEGGHFEDVAAELGIEDIGAGMSVDWADSDHDGRMDLYVGNMFSAAGNRVMAQRRFTEQREDTLVSDVQRMARGNALFIATKDGNYRDVSVESGASMGQWAWSSRFVDFNNDGWEDLVVANGYLTNRRTDDL